MTVTLEKREAIARFADDLLAGRGGDLPPMIGEVGAGDPKRNGKRLHLVAVGTLDAQATPCLKCGELLLSRPDTGPLRTTDERLWSRPDGYAGQANCIQQPKPPGKPFIPLAPDEGARK